MCGKFDSVFEQLRQFIPMKSLNLKIRWLLVVSNMFRGLTFFFYSVFVNWFFCDDDQMLQLLPDPGMNIKAIVSYDEMRLKRLAK